VFDVASAEEPPLSPVGTATPATHEDEVCRGPEELRAWTLWLLTASLVLAGVLASAGGLTIDLSDASAALQLIASFLLASVMLKTRWRSSRLGDCLGASSGSGFAIWAGWFALSRRLD
jgi:hypothetical protein